MIRLRIGLISLCVILAICAAIHILMGGTQERNPDLDVIRSQIQMSLQKASSTSNVRVLTSHINSSQTRMDGRWAIGDHRFDYCAEMDGSHLARLEVRLKDGELWQTIRP